MRIHKKIFLQKKCKKRIKTFEKKILKGDRGYKDETMTVKEPVPKPVNYTLHAEDAARESNSY